MRSLCAEQACVDDVCAGECAPGSTRCSADDIQRCTALGAWSSEACEGSPDVICGLEQGQARCLANPPSLLGLPELGTEDSMLTSAYVFLSPIDVGDRRLEVLAISVMAPPNTGGFVDLGIYSAAAGDPLRPYELLYAATDVALDGSAEASLSDCTLLEPNQRYWLALYSPQELPWPEVKTPGRNTYRVATPTLTLPGSIDFDSEDPPRELPDLGVNVAIRVRVRSAC